MQKVLGLGNALVDILIRLENDKLLEEFDFPKGSMQLIDREKAEEIYIRTEHLNRSMNSGGSAANTIHGLAALGIQTGYIGAIGKDDFGDFFRTDMEKKNIIPYLNLRETETGRASTLISTDSERTFGTYLGAALEISAEMLKPEYFKDYSYLHFEGYLVPNHELVAKALKLAYQFGLKVSIDMASYNIVEENRDFLKKIIKEHVDIVFANEEEAKAITGKNPEEALDELAKICDIAVVKIGKFGSLIKRGPKKYRIGIIDVNSVDTTGAGDLYASGFLYGLIKNHPLDTCGQIGSILSGKVIEVIGAKMNENRWVSINELVNPI